MFFIFLFKHPSNIKQPLLFFRLNDLRASRRETTTLPSCGRSRRKWRIRQLFGSGQDAVGGNVDEEAKLLEWVKKAKRRFFFFLFKVFLIFLLFLKVLLGFSGDDDDFEIHWGF